jgi:hypothetical protein
LGTKMEPKLISYAPIMAAMGRPKGTIEGGRAMKKIVSVMAIVAILSLACISLAAEQIPTIPPIPDKFKNIQVVTPDSSVPKDVAEFLGEWEGVWKYQGPMTVGRTYGQEVRRAKLIIYEASSSGKIKAIYGVSASPFGPGKGWREYDAEISKDGENNYFSFFPPSGFNMQFRLQNALLLGRQGGNYAIEMKKVK